MNIESRLPDIARDTQLSINAGAVEGRQVRNASKPEENLEQKPQASRFNSSNVDERPNTLKTVINTVDIKEAVEKINEFVHSQQKYINFSVDKETNSTVIKIFKTETGELLKQIPPEEILAVAAKLRKNIGWFIDSKA